MLLGAGGVKSRLKMCWNPAIGSKKSRSARQPSGVLARATVGGVARMLRAGKPYGNWIGAGSKTGEPGFRNHQKDLQASMGFQGTFTDRTFQPWRYARMVIPKQRQLLNKFHRLSMQPRFLASQRVIFQTPTTHHHHSPSLPT